MSVVIVTFVSVVPFKFVVTNDYFEVIAASNDSLPAGSEKLPVKVCACVCACGKIPVCILSFSNVNLY